jgi:hypothetical protein
MARVQTHSSLRQMLVLKTELHGLPRMSRPPPPAISCALRLAKSSRWLQSTVNSGNGKESKVSV